MAQARCFLAASRRVSLKGLAFPFSGFRFRVLRACGLPYRT